MGGSDKFHLIRNAPALAKQAAIACVPAIVAASPFDTEQARETEVSVLGTVLEFAARGYSNRVASLAAFNTPKSS
ncbi:hypothetical protein D3C72_2212760 [compost metagenome]